MKITKSKRLLIHIYFGSLFEESPGAEMYVCVYFTPSSYVHINPILCDCLLEKSEYHEVSILKWDDLFSR